VQLPQEEDVKYLGLHLGLTHLAQTHFRKMETIRNRPRPLLGRKSKLPTSNKLIICKIILKPIWTYGIQL
jgi:hypothetical protein